MNFNLGDITEGFFDRGRMSLRSMQVALENGNMLALRQEAQALKGASNYVSATRVRAVSSQLKSLVEGALATMAKDNETIDISNNERFVQQVKGLISRLESELQAFQSSLDANKGAKAPQAKDQNKFHYPDTSDGDAITEKEHEKKLLSWNKEVYEARVAKAFVEERIVRALYQQQVQQRGRIIYNQHNELVRQHQLQQRQMATPYVRKKVLERRTEEALVQAMQATSPRFRDIEALSPRLDSLALVRRGLPGNASGLAQPASADELTRSVQLPPIYTLMNPRNQMTSPLPDKETLMPNSARRKRSDEGFTKLRPLPAPQLLKFIATCFEEKRLQEIAKMRELGLPVPMEPGQVPVVVPLRSVVEGLLTKDHGHSDIRDEKLQQMRMSCSADKGHGSHPRVAIFRRMALWEDAPELEMVPYQEVACMQLLSWLGIASPSPLDRDVCMLLRLKDVQKIIEHLYRLRLIPENARRFLYDMAKGEAAELAKGETSPRHSSAAMCDSDALVWRWMENWGCWEPKVDL